MSTYGVHWVSKTPLLPSSRRLYGLLVEVGVVIISCPGASEFSQRPCSPPPHSKILWHATDHNAYNQRQETSINPQDSEVALQDNVTEIRSKNVMTREILRNARYIVVLEIEQMFKLKEILRNMNRLKA